MRSFQSNFLCFYAVFGKNPNDRRVRVGAARWEIMDPPLTHDIKETLICDGIMEFFFSIEICNWNYVIFFLSNPCIRAHLYQVKMEF